MATTTTKTNKPILPRGVDNRPVDSYNRAELYSGKALDFDGVNDVVTTGQNLGNPQTLSIAVRCRVDNMTDGVARGVISQWDNSDGWMIYKSSGSSVLAFWKNGGVVFTWDDSVSYSDQWVDLVYIIEQGVGNYIYVNGVLVGSDTTNTSDIDYTNNPTFKVGAYANTSTGFLNGAVGGVKVFNTVLTAAQVADLYNNPEKIVPTGVADSALKLWLPMQEGAGTTAYDGSGNGNHGTIIGATWTHGIGAPVAQTAVIDWNKGTNLLAYSQELNQSSKWFVFNSSVTANDTTAPDGTETADKVTYTATANGTINQQVDSLDISSNYTASVWIKGDANYTMKFGFYSPTQLADINITTEWQRFEYTATPLGYTRYPQITNDAGGVKTIYVWGWQLEKVSSAEAYIPTLSTTQTSPVLLPQGLTTGRDITGVNLFENVRKQGALNLDGNSWAEVHDNASLDFGTGSFSLEAWAKVKFVNNGSSYNAIMTLGGNASATGNANITMISGLTIAGIYNNSASGSSTLIEDNWIHIVFSYDQTNATLYINGSQVDQDARTAVDITNDLVKMIGRDTTNVRYYPGQIAQPRIYNRALTAEEVKRNYEVSDRELFGEQLLLDKYSGAAAAYSLRKLDNAYEGDAIVVRRASDNATKSIGFVNNELDTATLESFCSGTDGFVTTWYDQSGSGNDAAQTTSSAQPKIVSSGSTILENGKAAVEFDGVDDYLFNSFASALTQPINVYNIATYPTKSGNRYFFDSDGSPRFTMVRESGYLRFYAGIPVDLQESAYTFNTGQQYLLSVSGNGSSSYISVDGTIEQTGNASTSGMDAITIGSRYTLDDFANTKYQELIVFNNASNKSGIETNINDFYNIY